MRRVHINGAEIERMTREIQQEFDKHPIRVPVTADMPNVSGQGVHATFQDGQQQPVGPTYHYHGPVFLGSADGSQIAWNNGEVHQSQQGSEQITPGYEVVAAAVAKVLEGIPASGLSDEEATDATHAGEEILHEVVKPQPDRGKLRRALAALKGFLYPIATGAVRGTAAGCASGTEEWARVAIEHLGHPF